MRKPLSLVALGAVLYVVGFVLGSNDIDPASAIIATTGMGIALAGLVWAGAAGARRRRTG